MIAMHVQLRLSSRCHDDAIPSTCFSFWLSTRSPESPWRYPPYLLPHRPSPFVTMMPPPQERRPWGEESEDERGEAGSSSQDPWQKMRGQPSVSGAGPPPWATKNSRAYAGEEYYKWALTDRDLKERIEKWAREKAWWGRGQMWTSDGGPWFPEGEDWIEVPAQTCMPDRHEHHNWEPGRLCPNQWIPRQNMTLTMVLFLNHAEADPDCRMNVFQQAPWVQYMLALSGSPKFHSNGQDSNVNKVISGRIKDIYTMARMWGDPLILKSDFGPRAVAQPGAPRVAAETRERVRAWQQAMEVEGAVSDQMFQLGSVLYHALRGPDSIRGCRRDVAVALVENNVWPPPPPCPPPSEEQPAKAPPAKDAPPKAKAGPPVLPPDSSPPSDSAAAASDHVAATTGNEATTAGDDGVPKTAGYDEVFREPDVLPDPFAGLPNMEPLAGVPFESLVDLMDMMPRIPQGPLAADPFQPLVDFGDGNLPPGSYPCTEDLDANTCRAPPSPPCGEPDPQRQVDPPPPPPLPWESSAPRAGSPSSWKQVEEAMDQQQKINHHPRRT